MSNHTGLPLLALLGWFCFPTPCFATEPSSKAVVQTFGGLTMGTTYMVKTYGGPPIDTEMKFAIDAELRKVNDQMSTYLTSSEISRFNATDSTDWFDVSRETAEVVDFAQQLSKQTDGAFDVTVGPLVNAWSFGPGSKTKQIPSDGELDELGKSVGYGKLSIQLDPPAVRKSDPNLRIDLSAIAKGHGVDRLVALLNQRGAKNVFVEIGGEVRTSGDKGGQAWKVGIQMPDAAQQAVMIAHAMGDQEAMATSGDYRIFFEVDGKRYSHSIDPRTGKPVEHDLASVTVVTDTCMEADAWATAINVLGPEAGLAIAKREGIDVLLVSRRGDGFTLSGAGTLAQYAVNDSTDSGSSLTRVQHSGDVVSVMILAFGVFLVLICAMAVGVMFGRKPIAGSCGGLNNPANEDGSVNCSLCSNPADACTQLRERMERGKDPASESPS